MGGKVSTSPRTEIMLSSEDNGALISGDYKLIMGVQSYGFWTSLVYPNATTDHSKEREVDCGAGCLFNIKEDPSEYENLAATMPEKLKELQNVWQTRNATKYWPPHMLQDVAKCEAYLEAHQGF